MKTSVCSSSRPNLIELESPSPTSAMECFYL
jgi:hypothetical protein